MILHLRDLDLHLGRHHWDHLHLDYYRQDYRHRDFLDYRQEFPGWDYCFHYLPAVDHREFDLFGNLAVTLVLVFGELVVCLLLEYLTVQGPLHEGD